MAGSTIRIALADPAGEYRLLRETIDASVGRVLASGRYILGPEVESLEREAAGYLGVECAVGVSSGTDAILAALMTLGVGQGDEVVTSAFSFFATAGAILRLGARPVFADIEPDGFNMDPVKVRAAVTARTRAVVAVHLFGQVVDADAMARECGVPVVEDAAQAFGASLGTRKAGSLGIMGCFSFFPAKPLGCAGDGGLVSAGDERTASVLRSIRAHGASGKNVHDRVGGNFRLDPVQAAIVRAKLPHIDGWIARRRRYAELYRQRLAPLEEAGHVRLPSERPGTTSTWAQFVIRAKERDDLARALALAGIASEVYYPIPMPMQKAMGEGRARRGSYPAAERAAAEVLALPVHQLLEPADIEEVSAAIDAFYGGAS